MNFNMDLYNIYFFIFLAIALLCAWKISVADWRRRIIPDVYLFPLFLIGLIITVFFPWPGNIADSVIAAFAGYILTSLIGFLFEKINNKKGRKSYISPIGMGDIKLISAGGIWLGTTGLAISLVVSCLAGILWGKAKKQKFIPFAPFFIGSGFLTLLILGFLL